MKKILIAMLLAPALASAGPVHMPKNEWSPPWQNSGEGFPIRVKPLGSGAPEDFYTPSNGLDVANPVASGYFHVPGYMPGFPTAATVWPKLREVDCTRVGEKIVCDGYQVKPDDGHPEYIYVVPRVKEDLPAEEPKTKIVFVDRPEPPKLTPVPKPHRKHRVVHRQKPLQCK